MSVSYKKLWKLLIDRDMKKKDLCVAAGISHTSMAKLGKNENVTTLMVTHDISEAISMSDRVVVLTKRPATVKKIEKIEFEMENRNPMNVRKSPRFSKYFDSLWKELDVDAKEK